MKDYSKMSDFDINKAVALSLGVEVVEWNGKIFGGVERKIDNVTSVIGVIDYCNNPSDACPIIHDNKICIIFDSGRGIDGESMACDGFWIPGEFAWNVDCRDANPLRAAMIVYLMMKDAK